MTTQNAARAGEECLLLSDLASGGRTAESLDSPERIHLALFGDMPQVENWKIT